MKIEKLTAPQKSIWSVEQYFKGSSVNNICGTATFNEEIEFEKLKQAIKHVYKKHDNFKLRFKIDEGEIVQTISNNDNCEIKIIEVQSEEEFREKQEKIAREPFKIEEEPLAKFYIFTFPNGKGTFVPIMHHLISDAWTIALIYNEIIETYSAIKQNKTIESKEEYSYIDYINTEKEYKNSEKFKKDKQYWDEKFKTIPDIAVITGSIKGNIDRSNPTGERNQYTIEKEKMEKIKEYCKTNKISLYNFFMAVYAIYIGEISNLDEFVIGTPILNRTNYKEKNTAGMFVNMAPLKINIDEEIEFKQFVKNIAIDSMGMLKHQKYSYQYILEDLRERDKNIPSLYNILLSYQITNTTQNSSGVEYKTEWNFNGCCAEDIDIQIFDLNDTGELNISYDYKTSVYKKKDIEEIHERIINIIMQTISDENIKLKNIDIVTPIEKKKLLKDFNKTELEYDKNKPFVKYFEEQVELTPNEIAIVFENEKITYKQLNEKANSLAHLLREKGVTNNIIVGILEKRSPEVLISMIAVLKAGGSYIPIAIDYPNERIEYMLQDSNAKILLTSEKGRINTDKTIIDIRDPKIYEKDKENIDNISKPEDLSYFIYTSGSTGTPKGVMLKQENLSNFYNSMKTMIRYLQDRKNHKILSITTIAFDIFAFESLMSLTRGLTVYLTNENEQKMTTEIERIIKENKIEIMQTTPSVMKFHIGNIKNEENLKSLKYIVLAGEPLPKALVNTIKSMIPDVTIYNGYGPSETTIFSAVSDVTDEKTITIGRPIHNTQIYIVNKNKKIVPQGTIGEIYISGDGVGKGYMNKEKQTKENFVPDIFEPGKIMYRVGDLGTFSKSGKIKCYGRIDQQVKIRGLRIELLEIERQMQSIYNIQNCVVAKKEVKGKDVLCAYYVENGPVNKEMLKATLYAKLPEYMVPQCFVKLEEIPHTPNGKVDRKALPNPIIKKQDNANKQEKPTNDIEKLLMKIIKQKLGAKDIGIDTNIFELGADSLSIIGIVTELFRYNYNISVNEIYKNPTIRGISEKLSNCKKEEKEGQVSELRLLEINEKVKKLSKDVKPEKIETKYNVVLTGATGFFGCHLLAEMLDKKENIKKIYCIVRAKEDKTARERLINKVKFYFNDKYSNIFDEYVEIVEGKLGEKKFGLDNIEYENLVKKIDIVIHSAANVSHYGNYKDSEKSNITTTKNVIKFCKEAKAELHYISTMTVSGNYLEKQNENNMEVFNENSFYISQKYEDNIYSKSKLIAETLVIDYMGITNKATIYRLGDLTGRYVDGWFQENINNNATYLRLKSILEIGAIPEEIEKIKLELSPVDCVAKAVIDIIWSNKCTNRIFNVYNPNLIPLSDIQGVIKEQGYELEVVSNERFRKIIKDMSTNDEQQKKLIGIINDFTDSNDLIYNYTIESSNKITCQYLKSLGYDWVKMDDDYIRKMIEYMKYTKFIK